MAKQMHLDNHQGYKVEKTSSRPNKATQTASSLTSRLLPKRIIVAVSIMTGLRYLHLGLCQLVALQGTAMGQQLRDAEPWNGVILFRL